jgi:tetratricopeptide (TPR) repeat protein
MPTERRLTLEGFLRAFQAQDRNQPDHPFCFILGAGASKPSGVRTGAELARFFVEEMYHAENFGKEPMEQWATAEKLGIVGFDLTRAEEFYPQLYLRKFGEHPDRGYAFLEQEMGGREPSYGYSVLAWVLAQTPHKVVVTTNFDNLVADAISIHSSTFPRIVGHESLAGFVQAALRRPLVAKIHGDLGFAPRNTPEEIAELSDQWKTALKRVFERFTPIVIGYGGNDGSLMGTLEGLSPGVPESIYWCQRDESPVSPRVMKLLEQKKGDLVIIPGFDELMLKIQDHMRSHWKTPDLLEEMEKRQRDREKSYKDQRGRIATALTVQSKEAVVESQDQAASRKTETSEERDLADAAVRLLAPGEKEKPWWQWVMEAEREQDLERKESIFDQALKKMPREANLLGGYAAFLHNNRKDFDRTEQFYKHAIEANPSNAINLGNYALFLANNRKDFDRAEEFYKRAIEADPKNSNALGNYALLLKNNRKDFDRAEEFYKRAIEANPKKPKALGNYANLLKNNRKDFDRAEEFYKRAIEADPKNSNALGNYALFLADNRKDFDRAEEFYKRAIEANPKNPNALGNYANLLKNNRKDFDRAEEFYKRAIEADPKNSNALGNYASFLADNREDFHRVEEFYKRAIEADPSSAGHIGNYAGYLLGIGARTQGLDLLRQAESVVGENHTLLVELAFYRLAHDPKEEVQHLAQLKKLLESGARSVGWSFERNIKQAEKDGFPNVPLLRALAKVINDEAPLSTLDAVTGGRSKFNE